MIMLEYFDIINEKDEVIGKASREECHKNPKLLHRAVNIYIFKEQDFNVLLRVKRAKNVDVEKDAWAIVVGEHVKAGETYEQAVHRGLKEELDIEDLELKRISKKLQRMKNQSEMHENFIAVFKGEISQLKPDPIEVAAVEWINFEKLKADIEKHPESYVGYIKSALEVLLEFLEKR